MTKLQRLVSDYEICRNVYPGQAQQHAQCVVAPCFSCHFIGNDLGVFFFVLLFWQYLVR